MKKILIMALVAGLSFSAFTASARGIVHPGRVYGRSHVVVSTGIYAPFYPYYGFYGYPYPYPPFGYAPRPTRLDLKIEGIQNDYREKIWSARRDHSMDRKERKATVHQLKSDRDQAITDAKRNYYKSNG